ncbi:hypothetical protein GCM10011575_26860 [Microlunatus endophyticus]|uniref:Uncharacterized protein n=1 Tax=Microlunatus endophyticus TaxID=1716077 RepID=A0A917SBX5_9ACTN|nr:hypothetical protein GCM10011575_26860 [Microlunatus endophyticus]
MAAFESLSGGCRGQERGTAEDEDAHSVIISGFGWDCQWLCREQTCRQRPGWTVHGGRVTAAVAPTAKIHRASTMSGARGTLGWE